MHREAEELHFARALAWLGALALPVTLGLASGTLAGFVFCAGLGWL